MGNLCKQCFLLFVCLFVFWIICCNPPAAEHAGQIQTRAVWCNKLNFLTDLQPSPPWQYTAFCSAKWKSETGANWKVILFTLLQKQQKGCFCRWEILLLISTGDWIVYCIDCPSLWAGFYDNLSVSRMGGSAVVIH